MLKQTPSQTVGPFFHNGLIRGGENVLVDEQTTGQRIRILGTVWDGKHQPIPDALIEIWQADTRGYFNHPADPNHMQADAHFRGFGRCGTDLNGCFEFKTVKPGSTAGRDVQPQAPYVNVRIFSRGMLVQAVTRLYFSDESQNDGDAVLNSVPPERRTTLIAQREEAGDLPTYHFDIYLQGEHETVFFEP